MRKRLLVGLSAFMVTPLTVLIGLTCAWGDAGDDALAAFALKKYPRALQLARPAAESGNYLAQFTLGGIYESGKGASQNKNEAGKWLRKALNQATPAAQDGDPRAQFVLGEMQHQGWVLPKDDAEAVAWYRKAAEQGFGLAQFSLGSMYQWGLGVTKDDKEGAAWYRKAAEQGNAEAQASLGWVYQQGLGVTKDDKEALAWYRKAAQQGSAGAQNNLGQMYYQGQGVPKDYKEAVSWYSKAAQQGYALAQSNLGSMYRQGLGVSRDDKEAVALVRKGVEQGNAEAQFSLGLMYQYGLAVAKDEKTAVAWYRKAAEQGFAVAQNNLGCMYQEGLGVTEDDKEAVAWYRKAAEQGYANAQSNLGGMYATGYGVTKDSKQALTWYRKAAEQGFAPAQIALLELEKSHDAAPRAPSAAQRSQPSPAAPSAISKDEIRAMIRAAMQETLKDQDRALKTVYSDVDKPEYTAPENPKNFAVVIGVEKYASLPVADFADRDAEAVRANLTALGYPARNIYFLGGQQATRAKIAQSVNTWLPKRVGENSTVFFYYSGHGAPDPQTNQAYLVPIDGDPEDLDSTAYPIKQLYAKLGSLKAKHVIVALDSCFSGAGGRSVLAKGTRPLVNKIDLGALPDKVIALTASDKTEISGTIEDQGHGAFTYYLLKGLGGAAQDKAGHVTVRSLYDYLTPKVQDAARLHNRDQTPQLLPAGGDGAGTRLR